MVAAARAREDIHPATMAYIRHLVEVFRSASFHEACYVKNYMASDADIFRKGTLLQTRFFHTGILIIPCGYPSHL
uniref:Uncharacterized protein n=1 Tax=Oryza nivara TaxID=4536 RepID=A0A0E0JAR4_ORYNI